MKDINWNDNARGAVREFYQWANARFKSGCSVDADVFLKEFAESQQTKTVADAYDWANGKWGSEESTTIWLSSGGFFTYGGAITDQTVCTREQFEAYAREQQNGNWETNDLSTVQFKKAEQEGEKWTHFYGRVKCRIKHVIDEKAWVECESIREDVVKVSELRPIKPKLSQEQAKAVMEFATEHGLITEGQIWTGMERDIIEGPAND